MRVTWALLVAWCMVVATTTHDTHGSARHAGISAAPAFHHSLRHRNFTSLAPFVAPARAAFPVPPQPIEVVGAVVRELGISVATIAPVARGPPVS